MSDLIKLVKNLINALPDDKHQTSKLRSAVRALNDTLNKAGVNAEVTWVCSCMEVNRYDRGDVEGCPKHKGFFAPQSEHS